MPILAQHRVADAAEAVARIETLPAPCDAEWVIKRHTARALVATQAGERERGLEDARAAVVAAEKTALIVCCANAHRTLAELLWATGRTHAAATAVRRALALDEAKANAAAAASHEAALFPAARFDVMPRGTQLQRARQLPLICAGPWGQPRE